MDEEFSLVYLMETPTWVGLDFNPELNGEMTQMNDHLPAAPELNGEMIQMNPPSTYEVGAMDQEMLNYTMNFPMMTPPRAFLDTVTEFIFGGGSARNKSWTFDEEKLLLEAVKKYKTSWKTIMALYFEDTARNPNQLKQKWKEMIKSADKQKDAERKELYLEVRKLDDSLPKDKRNSRP